MNDTGAKQQIVDKIKDSSNILVTVSTNPSVDELSAALGLTLVLNKMNKHGTAVFSGELPPAITFLDPQKTFENTVDSLRDFIIALDKEKADHLRYKVDGDVVKIFITPYRTTITSDDLDFSQGDYNVELVLALNVKNQDHLDSALAAHGRILHDATVATISAGGDKSELGSIGWREENVSSLSEMIVALTEAVKSDKKLLDEQTATAFLTGIVAATDRFSNNKTSSRVMTIAAQLMAAGANQQLIASKLEEANEIGGDRGSGTGNESGSSSSENKGQNSDGTTDLSEGESTKLEKAPEPKKKTPPKKKEDDGSLTISHEKRGTLEEVSEQTEAERLAEAAKRAEEELAKQTKEVPTKEQDEAAKRAEQTLASQLAGVAPAAAADTPSVADLQKDLAEASSDVDEAAQQAPATVPQPPAQQPLSGAVSGDIWKAKDIQPPTLGGALNATTEQAAEDARRQEEDDRNRTILSHNSGYVGDSSPVFQSPLNAASIPEPEQPMIDPFQAATPAPTVNYDQPAPVLPPEPASAPTQTLADIDQQNRAPHEEARAAIDAAFNAAPQQPAVDPSAFAAAAPSPVPDLPPLPPLPDFSTLPPLPEAPSMAPPAPINQDGLPPENFEETLPPAPAPTQQQPADPAQFRIPGQG